MLHPFKNICYSADKLLDDCFKVRTFMSRLRRQSENQPDMWDPDKYFGMGFESLVESVFIQMGTNPIIQIKDYTPVTEGDMGVDGFGYGPDGETHTVQIKARSNNEAILTANKDHISNFVAHSLLKYEAKTMTIVTTAAGLHEGISEEMYRGQVRTIGFDDLRRLIDNNKMFWVNYRDSLFVK